MKKTLMTLAALALTASVANATPILGSYVGPVVIHYTGFETLITGTGQTLSGYYKVLDIEDPSLNVLWAPSKTDIITGTFSGLLSSSITHPTASSVSIDFTSGNTTLYENTSNTFNTAVPSSATLGTKVASINFVPGIDPSNSAATFQADLSALTGFTGGSGTGYGAVVPGSGQLAAPLDSNGFLAGAADLYFTATLTDLGSKAPLPGYRVGETGPVYGAAVPEPGTLALLGAGMLGLIGLKRRKA